MKQPLSLPQFRYAQQLPHRGSGMFNRNFNLIAPESSSVFVNSHGRSKPLPYIVGYKIHIHGQGRALSLRSHKFSNLLKQRLLRAIRCKRRRTVGTALAAVRNPQKLVATASRREGVYNRTGEPSVIFAEEEELHSE